MFKNLKLATKLSGAFLIVLALMAGLGTFAVTRLTIVNGAAVDLATSWMPSVRTALSMKASLNRVRVLEFKAIASGNADVVAASEKETGDKLAEMQRNQADYEKLVTSPEERAAFDSFKTEYAAYVAEHAKIVALIQQNKDDQAKVVLLGDSLRHYDALRTLADKLSDINIAGGDHAAQEAQATYASARVAIIGTIAGCSVLAMLMALVITRGITVPVRAAVDAANRLAAGDLTVRVPAQGTDEIGQLMSAMDGMVSKLAQVVTEVNSSAEALAGASEEVSATAQSLSQAASEQAAGVEETSASMEQMTASISQNTENAKVTD
ncbi:MAG TPA: MCP four helix bundle domain-containing protein, partial [Burkholderiaceae bacterium]